MVNACMRVHIINHCVHTPPPPVFAVPVTETDAEATFLAHMLKNVTDVKPNLSGTGWKWTAESPWPPVEKVKHTPFFTQDDYAPLRERLATEAPTAEVDTTGTYATIKTKVLRRNPTNEEGVESRFDTQVHLHPSHPA